MPRFHVDPDISTACTLDTSFYTDPAVFEQAKEKIFSPSWQFVGDAGQVNESGQCAPFTLLEPYLDEPLMLTQDTSGTIRCLSNVCTHRGTVLIKEPCRLSQLRCRYHGRIFKLDGTFQSMPEFKEVKDFPSPADNLTSLPLFRWGPLLFTTLHTGSSHLPYLGDMLDRVGWLPLNEFVYRPERSRDYFVNAHWALYCENYLEGFHIPFVHAGLNAVIDFGNYTTELFRYSNLQLGIAKDDEDCFDLPPSSPDYGRNVAAYYFFVFPNTMFNFYPWGLSINIVTPLATDRCKVSFLTYVWKEEKLGSGAGADLDTVELEDEEVVEAVQKGVRSRFYEHGRYSVTREQGTHHFHRIISSFMQ
ncbi:MAG TPA: SRPBCC family protein [Chitinophaga sp.]|uniref:aromatic ring-hydroxylating oxygenase subunit alpha n=1 Tax=Chitinophaga sp. TaxID=1869181 RepID=UPI002C2413DB|nr:SRPBCC family protein [Chitinophaga sp.]HVI48663.1 SRPBCC family protein [Chitinophaga sp.]